MIFPAKSEGLKGMRRSDRKLRNPPQELNASSRTWKKSHFDGFQANTPSCTEKASTDRNLGQLAEIIAYLGEANVSVSLSGENSFLVVIVTKKELLEF